MSRRPGTPDDECGEFSPDLIYVCTNPLGHDGPHEARAWDIEADDEPIDSWEVVG